MTEIEDVLKNIDFKKGTYNLPGISMNIKDLDVDEYEELQDREAALYDLDPKLPPKEILKKKREWNEYILNLAYGDQWKKQDLKQKVSASDYQILIEETFAFLGKFSGPKGAQRFISSLKETED